MISALVLFAAANPTDLFDGTIFLDQAFVKFWGHVLRGIYVLIALA